MTLDEAISLIEDEITMWDRASLKTRSDLQKSAINGQVIGLNKGLQVLRQMKDA